MSLSVSSACLLCSGWDQAEHVINKLKEQQLQLTQRPSGTHNAGVKIQDSSLLWEAVFWFAAFL